MRAATVTLAGCLFAFAVADIAQAREWRDAAGIVRAEADFVAVRNGKVFLEQADGTVVKLPFDLLSPADQAFVRTQTGDKPIPANP